LQYFALSSFFSEETVKAIERYLEIERIDPNPEEALFSNYKAGGQHMSTTALQEQYRRLNSYLGWGQEEKGDFRKATGHMMRKFFNTQLINAGMPEEIREHFMGHKYKNRVRDAYYLGSDDSLKEVYLKYMEHVTISDVKPPVSY
jgi:integrase